jgi:hypothetical protein
MRDRIKLTAEAFRMDEADAQSLLARVSLEVFKGLPRVT